VDARVIVPRSFIAELLTSGALDAWLSAPKRVLDMCTGSGCLGILAALRYSEARVDAADISADALAVAQINVARYELQARMRLLKADGWANLAAQAAKAWAAEPAHHDARYDLIVCNPPYVNARSMAALPAEYRAEPALALDGNAHGGTDGMDFVRRLLADAPRHMREGAVLVLEIGHERPHFEAAFATLQRQAVWLEVSAGANQVLLLTREALLGRDGVGQLDARLRILST
jgi:ribosomal protein L3 glutamine methyltransferase